jgi:CheY-like chemotaxis protein
LLVEDHEPTRTALAQLLTRRHYEVKTAASVAEARELSKQQEFQLLISDIGLPDGNGLELMSQLRAGNTALKGIALTGYGMEEDIARSQHAGFASHLTKPIRMQSLEAALAATLQS